MEGYSPQSGRDYRLKFDPERYSAQSKRVGRYGISAAEKIPGKAGDPGRPGFSYWNRGAEYYEDLPSLLRRRSISLPRDGRFWSNYTDLKLHDISSTSDAATDPECEPLDQNQPAGSDGFLRGTANSSRVNSGASYNRGGAFMHHGKFTTAREAVEAHNGEALGQ